MARYHWNIYRVIECAEKLFAPDLRLRFRVKGGQILLMQGTEILWNSTVLGGGYWDQIHQNDVTKVLLEYYSTPIADLRRRNVPEIDAWQSAEVVERLASLQPILLAADKRLGKNLQSIWLFTEKSGPARKISYLRIG